MSMMAKREAIVMTVAAVGGLIGANALFKPSPHHSIKAGMDSQLHSYNAHTKPHVEQDPRYALQFRDFVLGYDF
ncbi:hypothetical protein MFRU_009g03580 [Monilinia fructicola]|uniref:Uncharacterized protein n=1 Tax=Monilinia fructicola TaxID=38448 RepID=A0A5M9K6I4_MONFR|nr:hypothetical protein EYC84_006638 [Monilinia fructicola]KAG4031597.1 hypothetical protein MFRU_009g03580 [Monilinia fructicola]